MWDDKFSWAPGTLAKYEFTTLGGSAPERQAFNSFAENVLAARFRFCDESVTATLPGCVTTNSPSITHGL
jgi:hypothetical protein